MRGQKRLPARQQAARDDRIIAERARGFAWQTIADRHGISTRQCMNIWQGRAQNQHLVQSPRAELQDEIDVTDAILDELARLGESTTHDSVRLGVIKAKMTAQDRRLDLKRAAGMLPWNLGSIREEISTREIVEGICTVLKKHEQPREVLIDIMALLAELAGQHNLEDGWFKSPLSIESPSETD